MINEAVLDYYIYNGEIISSAQNKPFERIVSKSIYEVIRIIDGKPLYLKEHLDRLKKYSEIIGYEIKRSNKKINNEI